MTGLLFAFRQLIKILIRVVVVVVVNDVKHVLTLATKNETSVLLKKTKLITKANI